MNYAPTTVHVLMVSVLLIVVTLAVPASAQLVDDPLARAEGVRYDDPAAAMTILSDAIDSGDPERGAEAWAELLTLRSGLARDFGDLEAAAEDADRAIEWAERSGSRRLRAETLRVRGTIDAEMGDVETALSRFYEAADLLKDSEPSDVQLRVAIALGVANQMVENDDRARRHLETGLELARALGNRRQEATLLGNLAVAEAQDPERSIELHLEALAIAREIGDAVTAAYQLANLCDRNVQLGRLDEADGYCDDAVARLESLGHVRLLAGARASRATLYKEQGDLDAALDEMTAALDLARDSIPTVERDFLEQLARLHVQRGELDEALAAYRRFMDARERLWEERRTRTIEELEVQHEVAERERELELARTQSALQETRLQQRTVLAVVLGFGFLVVAGLALFVWRSNRQRAKLQRDLADRNQELERAVKTIGDLANRDPLTHLRNRRAFLEVAEQELARARRNRHPIAVVMIDIDRFKPLNDQFGHAVGDEVLKQVAETLRLTFRGLDVVCRWGGEEFVVLLPDTDLEAARLAAERARVAVAATATAGSEASLSVSITLGVALVTRDLNEAIEAADRAMYEGKRAGRNRVVVA
jgi:diguanylate cyclase (GGDEF)-like protein